LDVVREAASAVDLDDRDPLAVRGFERVVAADVDLAQRVTELCLPPPKLRERALAEVTALRVVDGYLRGRCHG
jgi:hypothetical protein